MVFVLAVGGAAGATVTVTEFPICTNGHASSPAISGNTVVWTDRRDGTSNIYGYSLATREEFSICTNGHAGDPAISGNTVVWSDRRDGTRDIYGYNLVTREEFPICTNGSPAWAAISGNTVVWMDYRNGKGDIYGYDLTTAEESLILSMESPYTSFDLRGISGDTILLRAYLGSGCEILAYDLTAHEMSTIYNWSAATAISGDTIIWLESSSGGWSMHSYSLSTCQETIAWTIAREGVEGWGYAYTDPAISGDTIAFRFWGYADDGSDWSKIYGYNLATHEEFLVRYIPSPPGTVYYGGVGIDNDTIVWPDRGNIYGETINSIPEPGTVALIAPALLGFAGIVWRRMRKG